MSRPDWMVSRRPTIMSGVVYDITAPSGARLSVGREGVSIHGVFPASSLDRMAGMLAHLSAGLQRRSVDDKGLHWVWGWLHAQGFKLQPLDGAGTNVCAESAGGPESG